MLPFSTNSVIQTPLALKNFQSFFPNNILMKFILFSQTMAEDISVQICLFLTMLFYYFNPLIVQKLNKSERFWKEIKKFLKNRVFDSLDFLRRILANILAGFSQKDIASITGYDFILEALSVAGLQEIGIILIFNLCKW